MAKIHKKETCFYCRYEISKYNKSNKFVKYNGKLKKVCKNCRKKTHKPLEAIYGNCDVQCKICKKPVIYKKCIACSVCDHFYHGKCINLNKDDITKIETICDFYICTLCNHNTLPNFCAPELDLVSVRQPSKFKKISRQCFTCSNSIEQKCYSNKHIVYNGSKNRLCINCSQLGLSIHVWDKSLIEFQDCSICKKLVKYEAIFCNGCQHLVHPYCNGISKRELDALGKIPDNWFCLKCNLEIFPNDTILEYTSKITQKCMLKKEYEMYSDCSICHKKVTGMETLACSSCNHWLHKNCIGKFKDRVEYQKFLHYYSSRLWECPSCLAEKLPFTLLEDREFFLLLLDMYEQPTYLNENNFQEVFMNLKKDEFFKIPNNFSSTDNKYLHSIDPDTNFHSRDTCEYTIITDDIKVRTPHDLAVMTFNIRSLRKNFHNLTNLLSRIKSKIHVICLTESWLGSLDNINDYKLDGYHVPIYQNRENDIHGGGVLTYIHKDIPKLK